MGFECIVGHEGQINVIKRALGTGKLPHAYIFSGMMGIGKMLVAMKTAQALQCRSEDERPCGRCSPCKKVENGCHPDVMTLEPEGNYIKIEQIRELQKRLGLKPFEGKATICIIDGADRMNINAANALLKTLEEPPAAVYIILLAENIRQIIPTILSRCQRLKFFSLSPSHVEDVLNEKMGIARNEAKVASRISEGSPGKAISFLEVFPPKERSKLLETITGLGGVEDIFLLSEELTNKESAERLMESLEVLKLFMRDMTLAKLGIGRDRMVNLDNFKTIERESGRYSLTKLIENVESVAQTEKAIMRNANKRLAVDNMLIGIFRGREEVCKEL